jgi:hypothetical protein
VLTSDQLEKPYWFQLLPPNRREVAEAVHRVMDEVDRLDAFSDDPGETMDTFQR